MNPDQPRPTLRKRFENRVLGPAVRSLPGPAKAAVGWTLNRVDPVVVRRFRARTGFTNPVPPVRLRARVGTPFLNDFVLQAEGSVRTLADACARAGRTLEEFDSILDLGCGPGRVLTALARESRDGVRLAGSDVDSEAISWLSRAYPELELAVNDFSPPLPFGEGDFELVYSISVLTHLDEDDQFAWLREIRRVLAPGGIALLTVHGPAAYETFRQRKTVSNSRDCSRRISERAALDSEGFVFESYHRSRWNQGMFSGIRGAYGLAFHSPDYIRREWAGILDVIDVVTPPPPHDWQDVVVARRPAD